MGTASATASSKAQLPAQGAVVLTPEQATAWTAYQALGAPDALTTQIQTATGGAGRPGQAPAQEARSARLAERRRLQGIGARPAAWRGQAHVRDPRGRAERRKGQNRLRQGPRHGRGGRRHRDPAGRPRQEPVGRLPARAPADGPGRPAGQRQAASPSPARTAGGGQPANAVDAYAQRMHAAARRRPSPFAPKPATPSA